VLCTPGVPGKLIYLLPQTRLLAGRQSCRGMGVPPGPYVCAYDLVHLGRKLHLVYEAF